MNNESVSIEVLIGSSITDEPDTRSSFDAVVSKSDSDMRAFKDVVQKLQKFVSWSNFDSVDYEDTDNLLESKIKLKIDDVCDAEVIFKKIDDASYDNLKFIVYSDYQSSLDSAAYWLSCMLR